jgi:hypothetical protein
MISVFDIFKIILGIIISAFILLLVFRFVGSYIQIGESGREVSTIINFKKTVETVYTTGVAADYDLKDSKTILDYNPPFIETPISFVDMSPTPLLLTAGDKYTVFRNEYDLGWWKYYFVESLPETKIIFVPLSGSSRAFSVMGNTTIMLPSTENTLTKVKFGLGCNGTEFWFGWERTKFLESVAPSVFSRIESYDLALNFCDNAEYFRSKGYILVTIADDEGPENAEFVINPIDDDIGYVNIKNGEVNEKYIYKNGLDVAALVLGGVKYYNYNNEKFLNELGVGIDVTSKEYGLLMSDPNFNRRCGKDSSEFVQTLESIKGAIPNVKGNARQEDASVFSFLIRQSESKYKVLEGEGCAS